MQGHIEPIEALDGDQLWPAVRMRIPKGWVDPQDVAQQIAGVEIPFDKRIKR